MDNEVAVQTKRRRIAHLETIIQGTALPEEVDEDDLIDSAALQEHRAKLRKDVVSQEKKMAQLTKPQGTLSDGQIVRTFVEPGVDAVAAPGFVRVFKRAEASLIVTRDPCSPTRPSLWWALLCGHRLATPAFVTSQGEHGSSVTYNGCLRTPRKLWISQAFVVANPAIFRVLNTALQQPASTWDLLRSEAEFLHAKLRDLGRPAMQKRPYAVVALITEAEHRRQVFQQLKGAFVATTFVDFVSARRSGGTIGACGR